MKNYQIDIDKPLQEKCGIVCIYTLTPTKQITMAIAAAGGIQHRGQQGAGIAQQTSHGLKTYMGNGLLREIFTPDIMEKFNNISSWTLMHCRYGTNGGYDPRNLQPCIITTKKKQKLAIVHNGEFVNTKKMRDMIGKEFPADISDTYLFAELLNTLPETNWDEKILKALSMVKGAYSLMIGVEDKIYVARDDLGIRPLIIGKLKNGWVIASETHALDKIGAQLIRSVRRGEVIKIEDTGFTVIHRGEQSTGHFCDFEWAYFSRPDSLLPMKHNGDSRDPKKWLSIQTFRERCGAFLAEEAPIINATFAVGVPDSGVAVTTGYANALHIPYRQVIVRDHFDQHGSQRLFMRDDQMKRIKKKVLGKLSLVPDLHIWKNAIVVIGDDSIVRGNVSAKITKAIFDLGAKEVHWIVGFPPVMHHCHLGVSIRTDSELIAARHKGDVKKIAKELGATSIRYITNRGFIKARLITSKLTNPKDAQEIFLANGGCGGCVTGRYPITSDGTIHSMTAALDVR